MTEKDPNEERSADMLLRTLKVKGVDKIEIGADDESFKLYLEAEDGSGVELDLTAEERNAIHNQFMVSDEVDTE